MRLKDLLGTLSYQLIITAFGFSIAATLLRLQAPDIAIALAETAGLCILLSLLFYRLSNHERSSEEQLITDATTQSEESKKSGEKAEIEAENE